MVRVVGGRIKKTGRRRGNSKDKKIVFTPKQETKIVQDLAIKILTGKSPHASNVAHRLKIPRWHAEELMQKAAELGTEELRRMRK